MKQRVSLARAFANAPEILLMDEPFAALDEQNKCLLQEELLRIWEGPGKTVVFITHSIDEALFLGDRVLVMRRAPAAQGPSTSRCRSSARATGGGEVEPSLGELFAESGASFATR